MQRLSDHSELAIFSDVILSEAANPGSHQKK